MSKIKEILVEPNKIYVGSTFKIKVKVEDDYFYKKRLISEDNLILTTENGEQIRTEWGVENE